LDVEGESWVQTVLLGPLEMKMAEDIEREWWAESEK